MKNPLIDTEEILAEAIYNKTIRKDAPAFCLFEDASHETKEEMRKLAREHLKRDAVLIPVDTKFVIGQQVEKVSGYRFPGIVIGVCHKLDGKVLYLVECIAEGAEGMCHIYSEAQLGLKKNEEENDKEQSTAGLLSTIA